MLVFEYYDGGSRGDGNDDDSGTFFFFFEAAIEMCSVPVVGSRALEI